MDQESLEHLTRLMRESRVATLGTVDTDGTPHLALVPFAVDPTGPAFLIHISRLARHTLDLVGDARAALLVAEADRPSRNPATLARVSFQGYAEPIARDDPAYDAARAVYLARHPAGEVTFQLADFILFRIWPESARFVAGFGRAFDLTVQELHLALLGPS